LKRTNCTTFAPAINQAIKCLLENHDNLARPQGIITTNPAEVKILVATVTGEWKTLILLDYFTGARLSDCCRMA
jgi:integrase